MSLAQINIRDVTQAHVMQRRCVGERALREKRSMMQQMHKNKHILVQLRLNKDGNQRKHSKLRRDTNY
jgi:hypothetical protein